MTKKYKKNIVWMFSISIFTFLVLLTSSFFIYSYFNLGDLFLTTSNIEEKENLLQIELLQQEKSNLISELKLKVTQYDSVILENEDLKLELLEEKASVQILIEKLEILEADVNNLSGLRKEFYKLKNQVKKKPLVTTNSAPNLTSTTTKQSEVIINKQDALPQTDEVVLVAPELSITELKISTFSEKKSGALVKTIEEGKIDKLCINYLLSKNENSGSGSTVFYVQIFNTKNKIVGLNEIVYLEGKELNYSFVSEVNYVNTSTYVKELFDVSSFNLKAGTYFVNVFDTNGNIVSSKSFYVK
jgi:hypothetical protein